MQTLKQAIDSSVDSFKLSINGSSTNSWTSFIHLF